MSDFLKPRRNEAVARIRTNGMGLVAVLIITNLLPLPSPWTAFRVIWEGTSGYGGMGVPSWWWALCISGTAFTLIHHLMESYICRVFSPTRLLIELAVMSVLAFNFLQASYALKYPPAPLPPPSTPAKPKAVPVTPQANSVSQRRLAITPNVRTTSVCFSFTTNGICQIIREVHSFKNRSHRLYMPHLQYQHLLERYTIRCPFRPHRLGRWIHLLHLLRVLHHPY